MKTCSLQESETLDPVHIAALLAFIPVFEDPAFCPDGQIPLEADGFPEDTFTTTVSRFMDACYKNGFVVRFDWEKWDETARSLIDQPERLHAADLPQLRRLLTWHVRQNRFSKHHLATHIASRHILALLQRINGLVVG